MSLPKLRQIFGGEGYLDKISIFYEVGNKAQDGLKFAHGLDSERDIDQIHTTASEEGKCVNLSRIPKI